MKIVWMYFETDIDIGRYCIRLFSTKAKAEAHKRKNNNGYGWVSEIKVDDEM